MLVVAVFSDCCANALPLGRTLSRPSSLLIAPQWQRKHGRSRLPELQQCVVHCLGTLHVRQIHRKKSRLICSVLCVKVRTRTIVTLAGLYETCCAGTNEYAHNCYAPRAKMTSRVEEPINEQCRPFPCWVACRARLMAKANECAPFMSQEHNCDFSRHLPFFCRPKALAFSVNRYTEH